MIVKICQGQPELSIRIVTPGCNGGQLINYKDIRMCIYAPKCEESLLSPMCFTGCWPGHDVEAYNERNCLPPQDMPLLVYPAFTINDNGETVFRFDAKLWERRGRYVGVIEFTDGTKITELDLDICNQPFIADRISLTSQSCGD